uniref:RRM domain-containing protein n=1 Tax=Caenorhabditis japonica TaxID=281687 RepID=A0A8R1HG70_CAEJA
MSAARIYIGRLTPRVTEGDVEHFFRGYGKIRDVLLKNGFGFVEFDDKRDAEDAVYDLNGKELGGERVILDYSKPRGGGPGGRGGPRVSSYGSGGGGGRFDRGGGGGGDRRRDSRYGRPYSTRHRVIVENLSSRISWQDLKDQVRRNGVEPTYAEAHKRPNEALLCFATSSDLKRCIEKCDGLNLNGRKVKMIDDSQAGSGRSRSRSRSNSRGRGRRRSRSRSSSRSKSRSKSRSRSRSRSPPTKRSKRESKSRSRSRSASRSRSRSAERLVCFTTHDDLREAMNKLQGEELNGRKLKCTDESRDRSRSRSPRRRSRSRSNSRSRSPPPRRRSPSSGSDRNRSASPKRRSDKRARSVSKSRSRSGGRRSRTSSPPNRSPSPRKTRRDGSSPRSGSATPDH